MWALNYNAEIAERGYNHVRVRGSDEEDADGDFEIVDADADDGLDADADADEELEWGPDSTELVRNPDQARADHEKTLRNAKKSRFEGSGVKHLIKPRAASTSGPVQTPNPPKKRSIPREYNGANHVLQSVRGRVQVPEMDETELRVYEAERRAQDAESRSLMLESVVASRLDQMDGTPASTPTLGMPVASSMGSTSDHVYAEHNPFEDMARVEGAGDLFNGGIPQYTSVRDQDTNVDAIRSSRVHEGDPFANWIDVVGPDGTVTGSIAGPDPDETQTRNKGGRPSKPGSTAAKQRASAKRRYHEDKAHGIGHKHQKPVELELDRERVELTPVSVPAPAQKKAKAKPKAKPLNLDAAAIVADIIAKLDAENEKKRQARKRVVPKNKIARELGKKTGVLVTREGAVIADERAAAIARARRANPKMVRDADQKRRESRAIN